MSRGNWSAIRCWSAPATAPSRRSRASRRQSGRVPDGDDPDYGDDAGDHGEPDGRPATAFEPGQEEWMNRDLGSRAAIERPLDTGLDNVFPEEPAEAAARTAQDAAPTAYSEWGGGASERRRLQS